MKHGRRALGFTLVEVLVALVVMAIMSLMAWQGVDGIARTREANEARLAQTMRLQSVVEQWEQDLASLQQSAAVPALTCDGQSVRLTRRTDGGLQVVAWSLRPDNQGSTWQRWAGPAVTTTTALQNSWLATQQFQGNETGQLRALGGIDQWQVYFYQGNAWANCQSTGNVVTPATPSAPASTPVGPPVQALPSGVRLVLAFAPGSGMTGSVVRDTLIAP
jgi:general secretion pathway protein J